MPVDVDPRKKELLERQLSGFQLAPDEVAYLGQPNTPRLGMPEIQAPDLLPAHAPTQPLQNQPALPAAPEILSRDQFLSQFPMYQEVIDTPDFRIHARKQGINLEPLRVDRESFFSQYPMYAQLQGDAEFESFLAENGVRFKEIAAPAHALTGATELLDPGAIPAPQPTQIDDPSLFGRLFGAKVETQPAPPDLTIPEDPRKLAALEPARAWIEKNADIVPRDMPATVVDPTAVLQKQPLTMEEAESAGLAGKTLVSPEEVLAERALEGMTTPRIGIGGPVRAPHILETAPGRAVVDPIKKAAGKIKDWASFEKQWQKVFGDDYVNVFSQKFEQVNPDWFAKMKRFTPDEIFDALTGRGEAPEELLNYLKGLSGKEKARAAKSMGIDYDPETGTFTILGKRESPPKAGPAEPPPPGAQATGATPKQPPPGPGPADDADVLYLPAPKPAKPTIATPDEAFVEPETTTVQMSPSFKKSMEYFLGLFKQGQSGGKTFTDATGQGGTPDIRAYSSGYPKIKGKDFSSLGVDRAGIVNIINKALSGKPLTDRQTRIFEEIVDEVRAQRAKIADMARQERKQARSAEQEEMDQEFEQEGVQETTAPYKPGFELPGTEIEKLKKIKEGMKESDSLAQETARQHLQQLEEKVAGTEFAKPQALTDEEKQAYEFLKANIDRPEALKGTTYDLAREGEVEYRPDMSKKYDDFLDGVKRRALQEDAGQAILDNLEEAGRSPKDVVSQFWSQTYSQLPDEVKKRFENYIRRETGLKPGDVVAMDKDRNKIIANSWEEVYPANEAASKAEHLEGTERGLISLMEIANQRAAQGKTGAPTGASKRESKLSERKGEYKAGKDDLIIYRGTRPGQETKNYYSPDREWTRQFTQSGRDNEITSARIQKKDIYRKDPLPSATSEKEFDAALKEAKEKGFAAMWLDEGPGEPNSVFIIDRSRINKVSESQPDLFGGEKEIKTKKPKPKQEELFKPEMPEGKIKAKSEVPEEGLFEEGGPNAKAKGEAQKKEELEKLQNRLFEGKEPPKDWGGTKDKVESKEHPHIWDAIERNSTLPEGIRPEVVRVESQFIENGNLIFKADKITLSTSEDVAFLLKNLSDHKQENFLAVYLDASDTIVAVRHFSMGTHNSTLVPFDEIPGAGLRLGAKSVWLVHNHPSESPIPSVDDFKITERVSQTLKSTGLSLKGHVVIDGPKYHGYISPEDLAKGANGSNENIQAYLNGRFKENRGAVAPHEMTIQPLHERLKKVGGERPQIKTGEEVARMIQKLTPGIKAIFADNAMNVNAIYSISVNLADKTVIPALVRLASKHAGKRIIIGGNFTRNDLPALRKIKEELAAANIDLDDAVQVNSSGWTHLSRGDSYVRDSGPLYDSIKKDDTIGTGGKKWSDSIDKAIRTLKVVKGIKRSDDLAAFDATIGTPVFIGEKHKTFAPLPKRALEMIFESDEILSRMAEKLTPYKDLNARQKKNVNRLLIEGSLSRTVYDDATLTRMAIDRFEREGYKAVRSAFDAALEEIKQMMITLHGGRMDLGPIFNEIDQAKKEGYVPFSRFGNWAFGIKDRSSGEIIHYGRAENRFSAAKQFVDLQNDFKKELASGTYQEIAPNKIPRPFRDSILGDMDPFSLAMLAKLAGVDSTVASEFLKQTENFFKAKGFRRHFIRRKDVPGFTEDLERSIADYMVNLSKYVARLKGVKDLKELGMKIDPKANPRLAEYAKEYIDYLSKPREEFSRFRSGMFLYYLWGNVKSAAVNATQPIATTLPWLSKYAPTKKVVPELIRAQKDVMKAIRLKNGLPEVDMDRLPADVRADAKKALAEGIISEQLIYEYMGLARGRSRLTRGLDSTAQEAIRLGGHLFAGAEKNNRLISFIAAHRLYAGSSAAGKFPNAAAFADDVVNKTQFIYNKANRPKIARGKGSLFFIFRSFTINYVEMLRRLSPNPKSLAMALGILGGMAGVFGLPFAEDIKDAYEWAYRKITGRGINIEHQARKWLHQWVSSNRAKDAILHGGSRATPIDLGGSLSMGDILPTPEGGKEESILPKLIGPPADVVNRAGRAARYLRRGETGRAIESIAPEAIRNPLVARRLKKEGVTTSTGRTILAPDEITSFERGAKSLGFQPSKLTRSREKREFEYSLKEGSREPQAVFLKRLAKAQKDGDTKEMLRILKEVAEYNKGKEQSEQVIITDRMLTRKLTEMVAPDDINILRSLPGKARQEYLKESELYK